MNSCFLFGHSDAPETCFPSLVEAIRKKRAQGVVDFYVGHYGAFDRLAARALAEVKKSDPSVRLYLLLPYHPVKRNPILPEGFSDLYYPFEKAPPEKVAIVCANQKMIRQCDHLIVYVNHPGKARDFYEYAVRKKDPPSILNLAGKDDVI